MRRPYPTDLSDAEWKYIEPHAPRPRGEGRPRIHSLQRFALLLSHPYRQSCFLPRRPTGQAPVCPWYCGSTALQTAVRRKACTDARDGPDFKLFDPTPQIVLRDAKLSGYLSSVLLFGEERTRRTASR